MKICIPTATDQGLEAPVFDHFGSAPFFTICDIDTSEVEIMNNANEHHAHGMCQPLAALAGKKIDAVVVGGAGARAVQKLNEGGIRVYRAISGTVKDVIEEVKKSGLEEITLDGACTQHDCH